MPVKLFLSAIFPSRSRAKASPAETLVTDYLTRIVRYVPCTTQFHTSEAAFFTWLDQQSARTTPTLILLDSRGKQLSSEEVAAHLGRLRDTGAQSIILAIGPAVLAVLILLLARAVRPKATGR